MYRSYRFGQKKKYHVSYVPMECGDGESSIRSYLVSLASWMKKRKPSTVEQMRQLWIQFAKNTATNKFWQLSNQKPPKQPVQDKYEIRELKRRLDVTETALEKENSKRHKLDK
ncbi:hypothetical protein AeMF1_020398 [Aphanomyces euteiches]|nr:hypothetical protein AeMF1_020398 [Aphanomyces euteiches]